VLQTEVKRFPLADFLLWHFATIATGGEVQFLMHFFFVFIVYCMPPA